MSVRLSVCMYVCLSVCTSVCLCVCMYVFMSVRLYVCLSVCLSVRLSICLYVCLSVCLCVCLYVCMSVCLSATKSKESFPFRNYQAGSSARSSKHRPKTHSKLQLPVLQQQSLLQLQTNYTQTSDNSASPLPLVKQANSANHHITKFPVWAKHHVSNLVATGRFPPSPTCGSDTACYTHTLYTLPNCMLNPHSVYSVQLHATLTPCTLCPTACYTHTLYTLSNCMLHPQPVHSVQQKSICLKFRTSRTGSHVTYSRHHNSSRFNFPILVHSWRFSAFHLLLSTALQ